MAPSSRSTYHARFASTSEAMAFEAWYTGPAGCDVDQLPDFVRAVLDRRAKGGLSCVEPPAAYWAWLEVRLDERREVTAKVRAKADEDEPCTECCGRGWDVFDAGHHGLEIERCDGCAMFPDDDEAIYAALRWWLKGSEELTQGLDRKNLPTALLNSVAGIALAAMEPAHGREQQASQARVQAAIDATVARTYHPEED